jgi:hypothetical protein
VDGVSVALKQGVEEFANKFMSLNVGPKILSGWWFGTMEFYDFPYIGKNDPN